MSVCACGVGVSGSVIGSECVCMGVSASGVVCVGWSECACVGAQECTFVGLRAWVEVSVRACEMSERTCACACVHAWDVRALDSVKIRDNLRVIYPGQKLRHARGEEANAWRLESKKPIFCSLTSA